MITILKLEPGFFPEIKKIDQNLEAYQKEVDGLIDIIEITPEIDLVVNDDFLGNDSDFTLNIRNQIFVFGNCYFVGRDSTNLSDDNIAKIFNSLMIYEQGFFLSEVI